MSITQKQKEKLESIRATYSALGCLANKWRLTSALEEKLDASGEDQTLYLRLSMAVDAGANELFLKQVKEGGSVEDREFHSRVVGFVCGETGFTTEIAEEVYESFCVLATEGQPAREEAAQKEAAKEEAAKPEESNSKSKIIFWIIVVLMTTNPIGYIMIPFWVAVVVVWLSKKIKANKERNDGGQQ